ncbi:uncharacterized protein TM35_000021120 [Trypanosoma theileri]|uniref:Uncharacterized protein n=1 Tax=Trypanosoma theileri TaxID=67003 RepID=A0A1X0P759_9TRYP|nr:uncharacterized protein TM35_000021120 [Trypanosoma theileri]ORC92786.1 hypothetical protein TM35_000021120 [Trypanosoma theileri]
MFFYSPGVQLIVPKGCSLRHSSSIPMVRPIRMIGIVHKVFVERGYGFILAAPPPVSLLKPLTSSRRVDGDSTGLNEQQMVSQKDPISVWFPLNSKSGGRLGKPEELREGSVSSFPSRGSYVTFTATCHHDAAKQVCVWRTQEVKPCDVKKKLQAALRTARDPRWDRITAEDVAKANREIAWYFAAEKPVSLQSPQRAQVSEDSAISTAALLEDDTDTEEQRSQMSQERMRRRLHKINEMARRFVVSETDLRRPLLWMRNVGGCSIDNEENKGSVNHFSKFSEDEKKRWERVQQYLNEQ